MSVLKFCCFFSNVVIVFFKQLCHIWVFKHTTLLNIAFNTNAVSLAFVVLRGLATLYLDVTSTPVNMYLYMCLLQRHCGAHKEYQTDAAH